MNLTMHGRIERCLLLSYRVPAASVVELLPPELEPMTVNGWAFLNIVVCRIASMRPAFVKPPIGIGYHHVAYRIHVRAHTWRGQLDGLYFLRSDADNELITSVGNALTDFRFNNSSIDLFQRDEAILLDVRSADGLGDAMLRATTSCGSLVPVDSPFASDTERAEALHYRPLSISVDHSIAETTLKLASVTRDERLWVEHPINVLDARWRYLESLGLEATLEQAVMVEPIEYVWELGDRATVVDVTCSRRQGEDRIETYPGLWPYPHRSGGAILLDLWKSTVLATTLLLIEHAIFFALDARRVIDQHSTYPTLYPNLLHQLFSNGIGWMVIRAIAYLIPLALLHNAFIRRVQLLQKKLGTITVVEVAGYISLSMFYIALFRLGDAPNDKPLWLLLKICLTAFVGPFIFMRMRMLSRLRGWIFRPST